MSTSPRTARKRSPRSEESGPVRIGELGFAALALAALCALATWFFFARGNLLWYGDAEAHLAIARRMIDSRTPGYAQIGTAWLPLPHFLMLPLAGNDYLYRTGLAGAIPSTLCFFFAAFCLYLLARWLFDSVPAALGATAVFVLNPNILYLQAIPMTEPVFFAACLSLLLCLVWFRRTQATAAIVWAGVASCAASLTRYEGWFLIPFVTLYFFFTAERRFRAALLFGAIASLAPLYWMGHNFRYYGDPLEFYRGEYSAKAIAERTRPPGGGPRYPGDGDLAKSIFYLRSAVWEVLGPGLCLVGLAGIAAALFRRMLWQVLFLALSPLFYVWSMYTSNVPIFIPSLEPHGYYNSRYALSAMPLLAFAAGALLTLIPVRFRRAGAALVIGIACGPWLLKPDPQQWLCWKESQVNSEARRAWTSQVAAYLREHYRTGDGIFTELGDLVGVYREAGIPQRELLHDGNNPQWMVTVVRPEVMLWEEWAIDIAGHPVTDAMHRASVKGLRYQCVKIVQVSGAPEIEIFRRE